MDSVSHLYSSQLVALALKTKRWLFFFFAMSSHGLHNLWASICPLSVLQESVTEQPHQVGR